MKLLYKIANLLVILAVAFLFSCGSSKPSAEEEPPSADEEQVAAGEEGEEEAEGEEGEEAEGEEGEEVEEGEEGTEEKDEIESLFGVTEVETAKEEKKPRKKSQTTQVDEESPFGGKSPDEKAKESETMEISTQPASGAQVSKPTTTTTPSTTTPTTASAGVKLEDKVANLELELKEKESTITNLKADIANLKADNNLKAQKIQQLQQQLQEQLQSAASKQITPAQPSEGQPSYSYSPAASITPEEFEERYQDALTKFNQRMYEETIAQLEAILAADSHHKLSGNAQYWIGECHYALRKYQQAVVDFEKVFTFVGSPKKDDAQLKLGICYLKIGDVSRAREEFGRLLADYPDSEYAPKAQKYLSQLANK